MAPATTTTGSRNERAWERIGVTLAGELLVLADDARLELLGRWEEIRRAEAELDDRLTVGIVGGTGVGKSTLINALAGEKISASGDRRPTTDRVVAYRHEQTPLPDGFPVDDIAQPQKVHGSAELERVIVLDFPDFDSVEELHHEVLRRFIPLLDVLVILVDDVKYGDARLFELLGKLPQSPENLHVVLNKVDSLQTRYPGEWRTVAAEIVADLRTKLAEHAGLALPAERFLALAALVAWEQRAVASAPAGGAGALDPGEFAAFVERLEGYRLERRRRLAKELNIEARQNALADDLIRALPGSAAADCVGRALDRLEQRRGDLARASSSLGSAVFDVDERRHVANDRLGQCSHLFGFPVDFVLSLRARLARRSARRARTPTLSAARIRQHFRPYLDAVGNLLHDLRQELGVHGLAVVAGSSEAAHDDEGLFPPALAELARRLAEWEAGFRRRSHRWNHVPAGFVGLAMLLGLVHPALDVAVDGWANGDGIPWGDVGTEAVRALVGVLNPVFLLGTVGSIALAYVVTALVAWTRQIHHIEHELRQVEELAGRLAADSGQARLDQLGERLTRWRDERERILALRG